MYLMLSGGLHPFAVAGETREQYIAQVANRRLNTSKLSPMSADLLKRLLAINPFERYSAGQALHHPWVSRRFTDSIPMNIDETFTTRQQMIQVNVRLLLES